MPKKFTKEDALKYLGKEITEVSEAFFRHVKYNRRITETARALRDLGFSISNAGKIYLTRPKKDDFEILVDRTGKPYAKVSGLVKRGGKSGHTGLFFPSKFKKEFMVSLRTWGKSGFSLFGVRREDIEVTPNGVRIFVDYIEIVPDRKYLPRFMEWLREVKLPMRD